MLELVVRWGDCLKLLKKRRFRLLWRWWYQARRIFPKKSFQKLWASLKGQGASVGELLASQTSTEFSLEAQNYFTDPKKSEEALGKISDPVF
tara:strand:- start:84 stop:359 length:276 start_codon:yes stop_codon:yes gene_type:complete